MDRVDQWSQRELRWMWKGFEAERHIRGEVETPIEALERIRLALGDAIDNSELTDIAGPIRSEMAIMLDMATEALTAHYIKEMNAKK